MSGKSLTERDFQEHTGAKGGGKLGRTREFLKEDDGFRTDRGSGPKTDYTTPPKENKRTGDKELPTVKPRK